MTHRGLSAVRARLEVDAANLPDPPEENDLEAIYDRHEQIAIAILDSEHA